MNCSTCSHTKSIKMFSTKGTYETTWKYCKHLLQQSKTPWCCRGNVLKKGTPEEPVKWGECPLEVMG